jgi:hypothetical protein
LGSISNNHARSIARLNKKEELDAKYNAIKNAIKDFYKGVDGIENIKMDMHENNHYTNVP